MLRSIPARVIVYAVATALAPSVTAAGLPPGPPKSAPDTRHVVTPAAKKINCGTHWTGWYQQIDPKTNPCPAGCEPGDKLQEKQYQQGATRLIDAQYQCYGVSTARSTALESSPVREARLSSNVVGTLSPESGRWNSLVTVRGPGFAKAERVSVIWYPGDDGAQKLAGQMTATLRKRTGADEIEIEMPRDAGGSTGGVVRVYVFMPQQLQPALAGRFMVSLTTTPPAENIPATPIMITTPPLQLTGTRFSTRTIDTPPLKLSGTRFPTKTIDTPSLQLIGTRFGTKTIDTPAFQLTGTRPRPTSSPRDRTIDTNEIRFKTAPK